MTNKAQVLLVYLKANDYKARLIRQADSIHTLEVKSSTQEDQAILRLLFKRCSFAIICSAIYLQTEQFVLLA